jgi:hypothetical protein
VKSERHPDTTAHFTEVFIPNVDMSIFPRIDSGNISADTEIIAKNMAHLYYYYLHGYQVLTQLMFHNF